MTWGFTLADLDAIVAARSEASAEHSWTAKLLQSGPQRVAKKFGEEAVEAVIAAVSGDKGELAKEAADVLFHLLVLLRSQGVPLAAVMSELESRTMQSGLQEKAKRTPD